MQNVILSSTAPRNIPSCTQDNNYEKLVNEQKDVDKSFVSADKTVYTKVQIYIGNQYLRIEDALGPSSFKLIKGEVMRLSK